MLRQGLKLGHGCFLLQPFKLLFTNDPIIKQYTVWPTDSIIKEITISLTHSLQE